MTVVSPARRQLSFKAPYCYPHQNGGAWFFRRDGYRTVLPSTTEPWYSPEYAYALTASGLTEFRARHTLGALPYSLAGAMSQYRQSSWYRLRTSAIRRKDEDETIELIRKAGWLDIRKLSSEAAQAFLRKFMDQQPDPRAAASILRRALEHTSKAGHLPDNPLKDFRLPKLPERTNAAIGANSVERATGPKQWTEADLEAFKGTLRPGSIERLAVLMVIHLDMPLSGLPHLTRTDLETDRRSRHPELAEELEASYPATVSNWVLQEDTRPATATGIKRRVDAATSSAGVPPATKRSLRLLGIERMADLMTGAV